MKQHLIVFLVAALMASTSCDGSDEPLPTPPGPSEPPAEMPAPVEGPCDLAITEVALYQAVKIPLMRDGMPVPMRNADVVERRPGLFRVYVQPGAIATGRQAEARVVISSSAGDRSFTEAKVITGPSSEPVPSSTFNILVPADVMTADARYTVSLTAPASCATTTRFPASGEVALGARRTGMLKVVLVPIRYTADGSNRLPDTSERQLSRYRDLLTALFPVEGVELTVRDVVSTSENLSMSDAWSSLLDSVRVLRGQDQPAHDVYYYGLVSPGTSFESYCRNSCVGGISYRAGVATPQARAGAGVGFAGDRAAGAMAHELAHSHGRLHAPCGATEGLDTGYPYPNGEVGSWGFDLRTNVLISARAKDVTSYCEPRWISDYTYQALLTRSALVNGGGGATPARVGAAETRFRVLVLDAHGEPRWGLPTSGPAPGDSERATVLGPDGGELVQVPVFRIAVSGGGAMVSVPEPAAGWHSIRVNGARRALPFDAPVAVRPLGP